MEKNKIEYSKEKEEIDKLDKVTREEVTRRETLFHLVRMYLLIQLSVLFHD